MNASLAQKYHQVSKLHIHLGILAIFHIVGIVGFTTQWTTLFLELTPFHLLLVFAYILSFQTLINRTFLVFMFFVAISSFFIELVGVQTGKIFGSYSYGEALGFKIGGTPLLIGVLWFILVWSIGYLLRDLRWHWLIKSLTGATMMLLIDIFIEPAAVELGFWQWENNTIPLQNYAAWFLISLGYFLIFFRTSFGDNPLTKYVYWMQLTFFISINLLIAVD
jgi:putative membrane protein